MRNYWRGAAVLLLAILTAPQLVFADNYAVTSNYTLQNQTIPYINDYPAHSQNGEWVEGWNNGVFGKWWVENGVVVPQNNLYVKSPRYSMGLPIVLAPANTQISYYCPAPSGYYPTIKQCSGPWRMNIRN